MARGQFGGQFQIRFEDDQIIVVDKNAGLLTVPTPKGDAPNLVDLLRRYLGTDEGPGFAYAVHRLDRPVSGVVLFAKSREVLDQMIPQFRDHKAKRSYVAAVSGLMEADEGTFDSWLAENQGTLRVYSTAPGNGRHAITHYKVRERFEATRTTLVDIQLETGLRNQIRAQFAEAGHPLLGEKKYLPEGHPDRKSVQGKARIFLHASRLEFAHPRSGRVMSFEAWLPPQLQTWIEQLKKAPPPVAKRKKKDRHRDRKNVGKRRK